MRPGPPAWLEGLAMRLLAVGEGVASVLGDLYEEYGTKPRGLRACWYVLTVLRLTVELRLMRGRRRHRERRSDKRRVLAMEWLVHDVRDALRGMRRRPAWSIAAIATFALGIGVTTGVFSVVYGALFRPLPYAEPDQLVRIGDRSPTLPLTSYSSMNVANFVDLQQSTRQFEGLEAFSYRGYNITGDLGPTSVVGLEVTPGFFGLLGVRPQFGRDLTADDGREGAAPVILLTHGFWREQFGGDLGVVGRQVTVNNVPHMVIGVLPERLSWPYQPRVFVPTRWTAEELSSRRRRWLDGIGRLAPGVTLEQGRAELESIFTRLVNAYPVENEDRTVAVGSLTEWMVGGSRRMLLLFGGATMLVLLIACVNVANLGIARATDRRHELAVRAALGAGRGRLARHFVLENLVVALVGGALGVLVSVGATRVVLALYGQTIPRTTEIGVDAAVLAFALVASAVSGIAAGLAPAFQLRGTRLTSGLREGGRGGHERGQRLRAALVVTEIALAVMLTSGAGLLIRTVNRMDNLDLGVNENNALSFQVSLPPARYASPEAVMAFYDDLLSRLETLPGVTAAGASTRAPLRGGTNGNLVIRNGQSVEPVIIEMREITEAYFDAVGMRIVAGRGVQRADVASGNVVVVNQALADAYFGGRDAMGQRIADAEGQRTWEIVGITNNVLEYGPGEPPRPTVYWPHGSRSMGPFVSGGMTVVVRTQRDPMSILPDVQQQVRALDADLPISAIATLGELAKGTVGWQRRSAMSSLSMLAGLALVLGAIGIYGLVAYAVSRRRRELGVRVTLGASTGSIAAMVVGQALRLALIGGAAGILASLAGARLLGSLLVGVAPSDPLTMAGVVALLGLVAVASAALPAFRASRVHPLEALRME